MIYTASFKIIKRLSDYCQLAISRGVPNWYKGGRYKKLAAPYQLVMLQKAAQQGTFDNDDIEMFSTAYYEEVLSKLNPYEVKEELMQVSGGKPVVLLSQEASDEYSIRHVIRAWFLQAGIECEEIK
mgnify:CR=1 FL=1